jgi:hypothetical protein
MAMAALGIAGGHISDPARFRGGLLGGLDSRAEVLTEEAAYSGLLDHLLALPGMIGVPRPYRRLAFFFFATLVAVFFPTVLRRANDLVLFAGFFDFFVVFLADFFGAFAALAIVFAAFLTGLGSRFAITSLAFFAPAFTAVSARVPAASAAKSVT